METPIRWRRSPESLLILALLLESSSATGCSNQGDGLQASIFFLETSTARVVSYEEVQAGITTSSLWHSPLVLSAICSLRKMGETVIEILHRHGAYNRCNFCLLLL